MFLKRLALDLEYGGVSRREVPSSRHIPYCRHVTDTIIKTKNDQYIAVIKMSGFSFQTADNRQLNTLLMQRNTFIKSLSSSNWCIYSHIIRKRVKPSLPGDFTSPFSKYVNERYFEMLSDRSMFTNELYLTIVRKPSSGRMGAIESITTLFKGASHAKQAELESERVNDLNEVISRFKEQFAPYGAQVLSIIERDGHYYSEPSAFLSQLLNGPHDWQLRLPRMGLDSFLPTHRPLFEKRALVLQGRSVTDSWFGSFLSIKEYPPEVVTGMLDRLLKLPREFIVSQSFSVFERDAARGEMDRRGGQLAAGDDAETSVAGMVASAKDNLMGGLSTYGDHHLTVMCLGRTMSEMERTTDEVATGLSEVAMVPVREDTNQENAYWAQLPGNQDYVARNSMISSMEVCAFSSFHNYPTGETTKLRWKSPISLLETSSFTPYYFNLHEKNGGERPPGNFLIVGPTGGGKTVLQGFLIAQLDRVTPAPHIVFFDKDRGGEIMVRALGGYYETLRLGVATGFNPLQLANEPRNREFLFQLVQYMCLLEGRTRLDPEEEDLVRSSVSKIMEFERSNRTMPNFYDLLQGSSAKKSGDIASRFYEWVVEDRNGWLFNNGDDRFSTDPRIIGFDMTEVLDNPRIRTAALMYIFHRCESKLKEDGTPAAYFIDEGWKYLKDPYFAVFITDKMKTIRKLNGVIGIGTQSGSDIMNTADPDTLIQQTQTKIFFANPDADETVHRTRFKLTAAEYNFVTRTDKAARSFLIKHGNDSVVAKLNLKGMPDVLKVLSADKDTLAEMDRLRAIHGDDPKGWLHPFMSAGMAENSDA